MSEPVRVELPEDVIRAIRCSTRPTLRLDEAAEWLGISVDSIERHLAECIVRLGRSRLVVTARVHEVLARELPEPSDPLEAFNAQLEAARHRT